MGERELQEQVATAKVGHLATLNADGSAHLVPLCFALGKERIYWAVDHKPKRSRSLRRITNLSRDPRVTLLVDHYEDDWTLLWWVRVEGLATLLEPGPEEAVAMGLLREKYEQYRARPPEGPAVRIAIHSWFAWPVTT